mmetsp:Transcript_8147/g.11222  ORF Transcript_8147/g.11222 Transcript_8147/m.11222 type:complete len:93 (-) Transcript_8147:104-382(-)
MSAGNMYLNIVLTTGGTNAARRIKCFDDIARETKNVSSVFGKSGIGNEVVAAVADEADRRRIYLRSLFSEAKRFSNLSGILPSNSLDTGQGF